LLRKQRKTLGVHFFSAAPCRPTAHPIA